MDLYDSLLFVHEEGFVRQVYWPVCWNGRSYLPYQSLTQHRCKYLARKSVLPSHKHKYSIYDDAAMVLVKKAHYTLAYRGGILLRIVRVLYLHRYNGGYTRVFLCTGSCGLTCGGLRCRRGGRVAREAAEYMGECESSCGGNDDCGEHHCLCSLGLGWYGREGVWPVVANPCIGYTDKGISYSCRWMQRCIAYSEASRSKYSIIQVSSSFFFEFVQASSALLGSVSNILLFSEPWTLGYIGAIVFLTLAFTFYIVGNIKVKKGTVALEPKLVQVSNPIQLRVEQQGIRVTVSVWK